jgi:hypothetical protein
MEMCREFHKCANCGEPATHAIRLNAPTSMSVWNMPLMPTGARIDAWLCRPCLMALQENAYADLYFGFYERQFDKVPTHNSPVQKAIKRSLKKALEVT